MMPADENFPSLQPNATKNIPSTDMFHRLALQDVDLNKMQEPAQSRKGGGGPAASTVPLKSDHQANVEFAREFVVELVEKIPKKSEKSIRGDKEDIVSIRSEGSFQSVLSSADNSSLPDLLQPESTYKKHTDTDTDTAEYESAADTGPSSPIENIIAEDLLASFERALDKKYPPSETGLPSEVEKKTVDTTASNSSDPSPSSDAYEDVADVGHVEAKPLDISDLCLCVNKLCLDSSVNSEGGEHSAFSSSDVVSFDTPVLDFSVTSSDKTIVIENSIDSSPCNTTHTVSKENNEPALVERKAELSENLPELVKTSEFLDDKSCELGTVSLDLKTTEIVETPKAKSTPLFIDRSPEVTLNESVGVSHPVNEASALTGKTSPGVELATVRSEASPDIKHTELKEPSPDIKHTELKEPSPDTKTVEVKEEPSFECKSEVTVIEEKHLEAKSADIKEAFAENLTELEGDITYKVKLVESDVEVNSVKTKEVTASEFKPAELEGITDFENKSSETKEETAEEKLTELNGKTALGSETAELIGEDLKAEKENTFTVESKDTSFEIKTSEAKEDAVFENKSIDLGESVHVAKPEELKESTFEFKLDEQKEDTLPETNELKLDTTTVAEKKETTTCAEADFDVISTLSKGIKSPHPSFIQRTEVNNSAPEKSNKCKEEIVPEPKFSGFEIKTSGEESEATSTKLDTLNSSLTEENFGSATLHKSEVRKEQTSPKEKPNKSTPLEPEATELVNSIEKHSALDEAKVVDTPTEFKTETKSDEQQNKTTSSPQETELLVEEITNSTVGKQPEQNFDQTFSYPELGSGDCRVHGQTVLSELFEICDRQQKELELGDGKFIDGNEFFSAPSKSVGLNETVVLSAVSDKDSEEFNESVTEEAEKILQIINSSVDASHTKLLEEKANSNILQGVSMENRQGDSVNIEEDNVNPFKTQSALRRSPPPTAKHSPRSASQGRGSSPSDSPRLRSKLSASAHTPDNTSPRDGRGDASPRLRSGKNSPDRRISSNRHDAFQGASSPFSNALSTLSPGSSGTDNSLPDINHSEAGPDIAEDANFQGGDVFKDPATFDFLNSVGNSNAPTDLRKESLYIKFDPLVGGARTTDPSIPLPPAVEEKSKTMGPPSTNTPPKDQHTNAATPRNNAAPRTKNAALSMVEKLISLSPSPQKVIQETPVKQEVTPVIKTEPDNSTLLEELYLLREILAKQDEKHQDDIARLQHEIETLQQQLKECEEREARLNKKVAEKSQGQKQMSIIMEEYEKTISRLVAEKEQERQAHELDRASLVKERDTALGHLANIEIAFSDLHQKYERSKAVVEGFKQNEEVLRASLAEYQETIHKQEQKYDLLKSHAMSQLENANQELDSFRRSQQAEAAKLKAMLKKAEVKTSSLEEMLEQKVKENQELASICDELISKVGSSE